MLYAYIYVHSNIYIYVHTNIYIYIHTNIYIYVHTNIYIYSYTHTHTQTFTAFFLKLETLGVQRFFPAPFPDHHYYTHDDLRRLVDQHAGVANSREKEALKMKLKSNKAPSITFVTTDKVCMCV